MPNINKKCECPYVKGEHKMGEPGCHWGPFPLTNKEQIVKTCLNVNCPERTGGKCTAGDSTPSSWEERVKFAVSMRQKLNLSPDQAEAIWQEIRDLLHKEIQESYERGRREGYTEGYREGKRDLDFKS